MKLIHNNKLQVCHILKCLVPVFLQCVLNSQVFSQELPSIQTDRPDQTESPFIVPKNHFQLETGVSFEKTDEDNSSYAHPSMLLKYGVNDNFELRLIPEYITTHFQNVKSSGISPVTIGFKVNLAKEKGILPIVSFIGHLTIPPLSSGNFKTSWYAPSFRFTLQHTLTEKLSLGYNLGAEWDGETPEPTFIYTLTTGYSISDKIGSYIEVYGFLIQKSIAEHRIDGGLTYLFKKNIQFDISGGLGISKYAPQYYVALGFSFRLKN